MIEFEVTMVKNLRIRGHSNVGKKDLIWPGTLSRLYIYIYMYLFIYLFICSILKDVFVGARSLEGLGTLGRLGLEGLLLFIYPNYIF